MTRRTALWIGLGCGFRAAAAIAADRNPELAAVERESNPEKRSKLALEFASGQVNRVVDAYLDAEPAVARTVLAKIVEAVELSRTSLEETGKHPRSRPKHFKRAEIETRKLIRDLEGAKRKLTFDERSDLDPTIARIEEINQQLLMGIMRKR